MGIDMKTIDTTWTVQDVLDANEVLDVRYDVEQSRKPKPPEGGPTV